MLVHSEYNDVVVFDRSEEGSGYWWFVSLFSSLPKLEAVFVPISSLQLSEVKSVAGVVVVNGSEEGGGWW